MVATTASAAQAYAPYADRAGPDASARSPEWLVHWLAVLIFFLREPLKAFRLLRSGRMGPAWWHDRPDLPAGSAQAYFASVRGAFGNSIRWMCIRHGIGPGHKDWPEVSRAIVAFGGSLEGFRAGAPPNGLEWWEHPGVIPGVVLVPGFSAYAAVATLPLVQRLAVANAPPPACQSKPRMQGCLRRGCPHRSGRFSLVRALVRRPGRQTARDCQHLTCLTHGAGAWPAPPSRLVPPENPMHAVRIQCVRSSDFPPAL